MNYAHTIEQVHTFLAQCGVAPKRVEGQVKGGFLVFLNNHDQVIAAIGKIRGAGGEVIYFSQGLGRNHYVRFYMPTVEGEAQ